MANSVTARFNDDCKVFVSMSDDTTVEKAVIIDAEGNETDIGGGGGSSDFSTAEVEIVNTCHANRTLNAIAVLDVMGEEAMGSSIPLFSNQSLTCKAVLFKGMQRFFAPDNTSTSVTGDISYDDENKSVTITGAGTITFSPVDE